MSDKPTHPISAPAAHADDQPHNLRTMYAHLTDDGTASLLPVGETFWAEVMRGEHAELEQGRLVSCYDFEESWTSWERHPEGDELVVLLRGQVTLLLERSDEIERVHLTEPGHFVSIPRGTWHTAHPVEPCTMLFITPGRGTEHRPA